MTENEISICDKLCKYIKYNLTTCIDSEIFEKSTMIELGEFYFQKTLTSVIDAKENLLKIVIKGLSNDKNLKEINEFYLSLCQLIEIEKLPKDIFGEVQKQYDELFIQKYSTISNKIDMKIAAINSNLLSVKNDIKNTIIKKPSLSLNRDLAIDEDFLQEQYKKCNDLRTQKEMILFSKQHLSRQLNRFCDLAEPQIVSNTLFRLSLDLSKNNALPVEDNFFFYKEVLEIVDDDLDRPYAIFFKVKLYTAIENLRKNYYYSNYNKSEEDNITKLNCAKEKIPAIDYLHSLKESNPQQYLDTLKQFTEEQKIIKELTNLLEDSVCLRERRGILLQSISLFKSKEYVIFSHIISLQIEGMFGDFLKDSTIFNRFTNMTIYTNDVLKEKIQHLQDLNIDIYPECVEYFMYYFNNKIRNIIAHGNYKLLYNSNSSAEVFAYELLLDLNTLVYMMSRKSETEKMNRFITGYKKYYKGLFEEDEHSHFGAMFNDMIGRKLISDYDYIGKNRPLQVAYWLINPYYERIYAFNGNKPDLLELRSDFLSKEFWEFIVKELNRLKESNYEIFTIDMEFLSVIKGLFKYRNLSPDVIDLLKQAHESLSIIKKLQESNN